MADKVTSGGFSYEVDFGWAKLPAGWSFHEIADVAVDSDDRVYVFTRGEHPLIVLDRNGGFLRSWGEGMFVRPHGLTIAPDGSLFCADDLDHTVRKYSPEGKLLFKLGSSGKPAPFFGGKPFNQPTKVALEPGTGAFYVADGYGNARVHKFSAEGELLFSWGRSGTDPGEFNVVHSIAVDGQGRVYVADRESHRIQVFDDRGTYLSQWNNLHRPCGLFISRTEPQLVYIGQLPTSLQVNCRYPNLGACLSIHDISGKRLASIGAPNPGENLPDEFIAPHCIAADSRGDLYVGEVAYTFYGSTLTPPRPVRCFRKLVRV